MAKERLIEQLRRRCATRSAPAARAARSPSSRSPTPTPASTRGSCRSALPRRVVDGPAARRLPPAPPLLREPDASGAPASSGRRRRSPRSRATPTTSTRSSSTPSTGPRSACPTTAAPGVPAEQTTTTPQTNPGGVRCTLADYMINVFGPRPASVVEPAGAAGRPRLRRPAARQRRRAVRARARSRRARSRPAQFVDLNDEDRRRRHRHQPRPPRRFDGRPSRRSRNAYRSGGDQRDQQPRPASRSSTCRGPDPGAFHDAYRVVGDPRAARARARHVPRNQVIWFGRGAADRRPAATRPRACSRWTAG